MNINCTVIIQICNFFLAWLILENVLLRPLLEKLVLKKKIANDFLDSIEHIKHDIEQLDYNQKEQWQKLNKYSLHNTPSLKNFNIIPSPQQNRCIDEIDSELVDVLSKQYTQRIMQWLKEVQ